MTRSINIREKVEVPDVPRVYVNVEFDPQGHITGVSLSEPSKFDNTAMGKLIVGINEAIERMIEDVSRGT